MSDLLDRWTSAELTELQALFQIRQAEAEQSRSKHGGF